MNAYTPEFLTLWTMPADYAGEIWPNYYSAGFGQCRDSDALERSNFAVALKAVRAVSADAEIVREGHWGVGWVEWIAIPADDAPALKVADALHIQANEYPVLDESDLSEREDAEAREVWANCYSPADRIAYIRNNDSQFEFRDLADMLGCVRGQYFAGYASELLCP